MPTRRTTQPVDDRQAGAIPPSSSDRSVPTEGPHVTLGARERNILLAVIFLPPIGAALAWLATSWPRWARVLATLWAVIIIIAAFGAATDMFVQRSVDQSNVTNSNVGTRLDTVTPAPTSP
jgi:hypothetical protein